MDANFLVKALFLGYGIGRLNSDATYSIVEGRLVTFNAKDHNDYYFTHKIEEDLSDENWIITEPWRGLN